MAQKRGAVPMRVPLTEDCISEYKDHGRCNVEGTGEMYITLEMGLGVGILSKEQNSKSGHVR